MINLINNDEKDYYLSPCFSNYILDISNIQIIKEKNRALIGKETNIIYQITITDNQNKNKFNNISTINFVNIKLF